MHLTSLQSISWLAGFLGYALLMLVLVVRKRYRVFPWFTFLLAQEIVQSIILFETHRNANPRTYFYTYWSFELFDALVRVAVFFELARITSRLLRENGSERTRLLMNAFIIAAAICAGVVLHSHGVGNVIATTSLKISLCTSILGAVLVFSYVLSTFLVGLRTRVHSHALAYGLFLYFLAKLIAQGGILFSFPLWHKLQNMTAPLYIVCLFAWSAILWFDEPKRVLIEEMERLRQTCAEIDSKLSQERASLPPTLTDILGL